MRYEFKRYFNDASTRAAAAEKVYASPEFLDVARTAIRDYLVTEGADVTYIGKRALGGLKPKSGDEKYLSAALKTLKEEFPDLNHIRVTSTGLLSFDTKPRSVMRTVGRAMREFFPV